MTRPSDPKLTWRRNGRVARGSFPRETAAETSAGEAITRDTTGCYEKSTKKKKALTPREAVSESIYAACSLDCHRQRSIRCLFVCDVGTSEDTDGAGSRVHSLGRATRGARILPILGAYHRRVATCRRALYAGYARGGLDRDWCPCGSVLFVSRRRHGARRRPCLRVLGCSDHASCDARSRNPCCHLRCDSRMRFLIGKELCNSPTWRRARLCACHH